jgi:hypothetical protein
VRRIYGGFLIDGVNEDRYDLCPRQKKCACRPFSPLRDGEFCFGTVANINILFNRFYHVIRNGRRVVLGHPLTRIRGRAHTLYVLSAMPRRCESDRTKWHIELTTIEDNLQYLMLITQVNEIPARDHSLLPT